MLTATLAQIPVGKLLVSGFFPGLMMATTYVIFVFIRVRLNPGLAPIYDAPPAPMKIKLYATVKLAPFSIVFFMVMGFILFGITTPSEAAATGAIGAVIVALIYRRLSMRVFSDALRDAHAHRRDDPPDHQRVHRHEPDAGAQRGHARGS